MPATTLTHWTEASVDGAIEMESGAVNLIGAFV